MTDWISESKRGVDLHFFNTLTRQKEKFEPIDRSGVKLYTCGPTVYSYAHIGNFRAYVFEDLLRRTLRFFDYPVEHVMNLTDVDDKTIRGAIAQGVTLNDYTAPYKQAFFDDLKALNILPADNYPAATDYIPQMIDMIQQLIDKGSAYQGGDGSVYYSIKSFPNYGCLSHLKLDELESGASDRVASDEYEKETASDFVLWKGYDQERDGDIYWESPFGKGRPGWHLECSAMAIELLGSQIDIHCGGVDNIFPHHENEIAQSEACTGHKFSRYWLHCEHLIVDGKKMAKSAGNFYTFRDLLDRGFSGEAVRYMLLHTYYRAQLNFSFDEARGISSSIERLNTFARRLSEPQNGPGGKFGPLVRQHMRTFAQALADDLNISGALGTIFELVREGNALLDTADLSPTEAAEGTLAMQAFDSILGFIRFEEDSLTEAVQRLVDERQTARQDKDWGRADELRDEITAIGYAIEDTPAGPRAIKKT